MCMLRFIPQKQPNNWTCWPTVLAMITGKSVNYVTAFIGHDGGEIVEDQTAPLVAGERRRGIYDAEAHVYLMKHGWTLGAWFDGHPATTGAATKDWGCWSQYPAVLVVESQRFAGCTHVVLWDGQAVLDPNPEKADRVELAGYKIRQWWPLVFWGDRFFSKIQYNG